MGSVDFFPSIHNKIPTQDFSHQLSTAILAMVDVILVVSSQSLFQPKTPETKNVIIGVGLGELALEKLPLSFGRTHSEGILGFAFLVFFTDSTMAVNHH